MTRIVEDIAWLGRTELILKPDNEPAILKVLKGSSQTARVDIQAMEQIRDEQAVKYDPKTNGDADNAVKQVTKLLRALEICLGQGAGEKIPTSDPLLTWLVKHAA